MRTSPALFQHAAKAAAKKVHLLQYRQLHAPKAVRSLAVRHRPRAPFSSPVIAVVDTRFFTSSAAFNKKKDKHGRKGDESSGGDSKSSPANTDASSSSDPFDLTQLHKGIGDALARFKDDLHKLRSGGRLNPEAIENLRVHVTKGSNETVKLGELAQVVPKGGRAVTIIVGEEDVSCSDCFFLSFFFPFSFCDLIPLQ